MADRFVTNHHKERVLHRGTGCHTCRQRKVKCDGQRPSCGRCTKSHADCSYDEEIKKSKITVLRDEIAMLRSRVHELESGAAQSLSASTDYQSSPAAVPTNWSPSPAPSDAISTFNGYPNQHREVSPQANVFPKGEQFQPMPFADPGFPYLIPQQPPNVLTVPMPNDNPGWVAPSPTNSLVFGDRFDQPPSLQETMHNLSIILPYRLQCAFEIDISSFEASLEDPDVTNRPHEALINAIALMACYYDSRKASRVPFFVECTRRCLQNSLTGIRSRKVIQQIQAGHLLSCYLYWTGSLLEGHAALANAVSLARLCNLHKINSSDWNSRGDNLLEESPYRPQLRPMPSLLDHSLSRNATEHGERIHCFWNLLLVDTGGSVSTGYPCQFTASDSDPGTKIETVYPLPLEEYASPAARADVPTSAYSDIFNPHQLASQADTPLISRIKAALLLHRAARLGTVGKSGQNEEFYQQWVNLRECIHCFLDSLNRSYPLRRPSQRRPVGLDLTDERKDFLYLFISRSLALCAQIVMYSITPPAWRIQNQQIQVEALSAANGVVDVIEGMDPSEDELRMLDVMVGFAWMTAANFLITLRNTHERGVATGEFAPGSFDVKVADRQLDVLDAAATRLAQVCKPVVRQVDGTRKFRQRGGDPYQASRVQTPETAWS
ncbi:hypothetical protein BDV93DRAFT_518151 [Ceratobasidium sp. AG-I]|nr:hypothetical protein BDV93DRAFT_518151 [Ceratobasidium sp. AG-I]